MASGNADGESLPQRVIGGGIAPHQFHCGPVILPWLTTLEWIGTQLPRSHLDLVRVTSAASMGIAVFFTSLHILWPVYPLENRYRIQRANGIPLPESSFELAPAHACAFRAISS